MKEQLWMIGDACFMSNDDVTEYLLRISEGRRDLRDVEVEQYERRTGMTPSEFRMWVSEAIEAMSTWIEEYDDYCHDDGGPDVDADKTSKTHVQSCAENFVAAIAECVDWSNASWRPTGTVMSGAEFLDIFCHAALECGYRNDYSCECEEVPNE